MGTLFKRGDRGGKDGVWYAEFTTHTGERVKRSTKTRTKKVAQQILNHWETEEAKRSSGFIDPAAERFRDQRIRQVQSHIEEWISSLKTSGRSEVHVERTEKRIEAIVASTKWETLADITPESVERFAAQLRELNRSNQTVAHYLQSAKQFARWLTRTGRLPFNPLDPITKPNPKADRRRKRRMLLPAEWPFLESAATLERRVLYRLAIETGLRAGEIRELRGAHLLIDDKQPKVMVPSNDTKDHRDAHQFITKSLALALAEFAKRGSKPAFELPGEHEMAGMIRLDLSKARSSWEKIVSKGEAKDSDFLLAKNHTGENFDFHSLRHTCGAWLAIRGVHPKKIQTIMRHKTITLTMDTYGHLFPDDAAGAVNELESMLRMGS